MGSPEEAAVIISHVGCAVRTETFNHIPGHGAHGAPYRLDSRLKPLLQALNHVLVKSKLKTLSLCTLCLCGKYL